MLLDEKRLLHAAKSSSCHRDHRDVARAAKSREATLFTNVMRDQKAAHHHDVLQRIGACQLCSSALLGEELCFRHTTILGSCRDLTALAAPPSPPMQHLWSFRRLRCIVWSPWLSEKKPGQAHAYGLVRASSGHKTIG